MLLSFVIPEIVLGVGLFYMVTLLTTPFVLGTTAQVVGLVTFQLSYPVVIVRARLATIGPQYEEAARDLGAGALEAMRRVLLPMLMPAIFTSAVLVFADVLDDFVIVRYLSSDAFTETTSIKIYNTARAAPTPALNARRDASCSSRRSSSSCWAGWPSGGSAAARRSRLASAASPARCDVAADGAPDTRARAPWPAVRTPLPGPRSAALLARKDAVLHGPLRDGDNVPSCWGARPGTSSRTSTATSSPTT